MSLISWDYPLTQAKNYLFFYIRLAMEKTGLFVPYIQNWWSLELMLGNGTPIGVHQTTIWSVASKPPPPHSVVSESWICACRLICAPWLHWIKYASTVAHTVKSAKYTQDNIRRRHVHKKEYLSDENLYYCNNFFLQIFCISCILAPLLTPLEVGPRYCAYPA